MPDIGTRRSTSHPRSASLKAAGGSWVRTGMELARVESEQLWTADANSFSDWLKAQAAKAGVDESNFWRYLSAIRFYAELRQILTDAGLDCPELGKLSDKVSPENLELLSKLVRVMPSERFADVATRVLSRDAKRDELRKLWQTYRPALGGRTARGMGVDAPALDLSNPTERSRMAVAQARLLLVAAPHNWVSKPAPAFFRAFHDVRITGMSALQGNSGLDMVAVVKRSDSAPIELHGVEIRVNFSVQSIPVIEELGPWVNYLWVAFTKPVSSGSKAMIPPHIGILTVKDGAISVERPAELRPPQPEAILAMTQHFLHKALAR